MVSPWVWTLLLSLLVYTTVWPLDRLPGGDSGELLAEACVGGVAHPPGYPLLLVLLRLVRWISTTAGNSTHFVLWANAVNALFAATAAACVTHVVYRMTRKDALVEAVAAGLCFALSKLTWEYARGLEVFALNNLLVGLLHILLVKHFVHPTMKNVCVGAFVCGLGLANQHTIVLFEVPFILWVLLTRRFRMVELLAVAGAFLAGLSLYLQTFISAQVPTPGTWGDTSTLTGLQLPTVEFAGCLGLIFIVVAILGLFDHVRRKEYGTFRLSPLQGDSAGLLVRLKIYATDFVEDFHWFGLILTCIGVKSVLFPEKSVQKETTPWSRRVGYAQMTAFVFYLLVFHSLANLPLDSPMPRAVSSRFNMQPNTILGIWLGLGLAVFTREITHLVAADGHWTKAVRYSICVALVAAQYHRNQPEGDVFPEDTIRSHGTSILDAVPRDGILLSYTDINWNSIRYLQICEGVRPDVTHLSLQLLPSPWFLRQHSLYPNIIFPPIHQGVSTVRKSPGYARLLHDFTAANLAQHEDIFLDLHAVNDDDISSNGQYLGFVFVPHGLVWKVSVPPATTADLDAQYSKWKVLPLPDVHFSPSLYPAGSWEFAASTIANDGCYQGALFALSYWLERGKTIQHAHEAAKYVLGMRHAFQLLEQVEVAAAVCDGSWGLTYDAYDLVKNANLAAMRYYNGLELMQPLIGPLKENQAHTGASDEEKLEIQELEKMVKGIFETRQLVIHRLESFLKEMKLREDHDIKSFENFVESQKNNNSKKKTNKKKTKKNNSKKKTNKKKTKKNKI
ncbi:Transmembrane protein 260 [Phytophthora citrophthora]|uniref:Transmembrane protein 260 n=1 Tax=Phytophthora citrophthora TaxID=4793 RepID=A0AAD9GGX6_9STRA|nr:Transmembrane protein 260 [Phytophthora citrophthora]